MKASPKSEVRSPKVNPQPATRFPQLKVLCHAACSLSLLLLILGSCHSGTQKTVQGQKPDETGVAKLVVSEEIHNFGALKAGEVVSFTFSFRNEGTRTLIIDHAVADCGCTEVIVPEKNIAPGKEGHIEVIFNSAGEVGKQLKTVTITSNAEEAKKQIFIRANVTNELIEIYS